MLRTVRDIPKLWWASDLQIANVPAGNAPDAVRDQMMRHDPKFLTFHDAYLNQMVEFNLQNTFLKEQTESELYKLFAHVSLTRDP